MAYDAELPILFGHQYGFVIGRMGRVATHAVERLLRPRIYNADTHRMVVGLDRILVAPQTQFHDVGGTQQTLIATGVRLVTVTAILERHLVFFAAFELGSVVAHQTGTDAALQLERSAVADMRPVA